MSDKEVTVEQLYQEQIDKGNIELTSDARYVLRRGDGVTKTSKDVIWIEWDDDGRFKAKHDGPEIGRSLLMSPFNAHFTWQTTKVTSFEVTNEGIKFNTENSKYVLRKIAEK